MFPYGRQSISQDDINEVIRVLKSDFLTTGPEVPAFEKAFASFVDVPHALACSNGTAALHLVALALDLKPGDQVIVPTLSFVATANGPRYCGADIIFSDVDPDTGLATPSTIKQAMERADPKRLKAIFVVHLNGAPVDMAGIAKLARNAGVALVEDACHAVGSRYGLDNGKNEKGHVGDCQLSDFAVFSFHPVKTLTTGEGGMVTTRNEEMARKLALLRNHGLVREQEDWIDKDIGFDSKTGEPNPWAYELQMLGYNYRLTDFQAALGRSQLKKMDTFGPQRQQLVAYYREKMIGLGSLARPFPASTDKDAVLHLMVALIDFEKLGKSRAQVMAELRQGGVGTQVHYIPIHRQPYYRLLDPDLHLEGAERYYARCLSLPLYPAMSKDDVESVIRVLAGVLADRGDM